MRPGAATVVLGFFALASATASSNELPAGLAGLLSPAQVPDGPPGCVRADTRQRFAVHAGPGTETRRLGWLGFRPWGGSVDECEAAEARFEPEGGTAHLPVTTLESSYEVPALPVLEVRGDWMRIALGAETGWLQRPADASYTDYPALLTDKLAYATAAWDGRLCAAPGDSCAAAGDVPEQPLRVLGVRRHAGADWLEVELTNDPCRGADPVVLDRGWMRALSGEGERPAAWFHSRGC